MKLIDILGKIEYSCICGNLDCEISDVIYDSRKAKKDCVFVCLKGADMDGHKYVKQAVDNGAVAVVAQEPLDVGSATLILVKDSRYALAFMSAEFFGNPARELKVIGITGTKGKTTTACMIKGILEKGGLKTGLIGTLGVIIGNKTIKTNNTTPESYEIQMYLRKMVDEGCKCAVMEVSSLGLKWHRTQGFIFDYGVFTNFSEDHIGSNEHESMDEYLYCKNMLFKQCKLGLVNIDDKSYLNIISGHTCKIETFGFSKDADLAASDRSLISRPGYLGTHFETKGLIDLSVDVSIPGKFSVYNALGAIAVCHHFDIPKSAITEALNEVKVKGRVEAVKVPGDYTLLIDYAHNAVSMENILKTLRDYNPGRIVTVFGAGGNRAKSRRYEMGEISGKLADLSVLTADNSRFEDVNDIIADIKIGIGKTDGEFVVIPDRKDAIKYSIMNAKAGDIIVLAGKGHEDYQEIRGVKHHFDEREVISDIMGELEEEGFYARALH